MKHGAKKNRLPSPRNIFQPDITERKHSIPGTRSLLSSSFLNFPGKTFWRSNPWELLFLFARRATSSSILTRLFLFLDYVISIVRRESRGTTLEIFMRRARNSKRDRCFFKQIFLRRSVWKGKSTIEIALRLAAAFCRRSADVRSRPVRYLNPYAS